jgi:hypothetical protein
MPDTPSQQVAVDNGIDLVGPGTRLIDTLRPDCDRALRIGKEAIKIFKIRL